MADTFTPNLSIALYRYLCQNIVGSEDYVKRIRIMNAVRDDFESNKKVTIITSGSFGEGLELRGSDIDIMHVDHGFEVCEDMKPRVTPNRTLFSMVTDDVKPGFTQLKLEHCTFLDALNCCKEYNGEYYLSSEIFKHHFLFEGVCIHGPCISDEDDTIDLAICIHCKKWISSAVQWVTRSSNSWPSNEVKQNILKHGVIVVPIGVKDSLKEDLEWRISFSVGEKLLINSFTHTQLLCYALLKIILKDVIGTHSDCNDLLCSYFLKTIVFWISEELQESVWTPDNIIPCFMQCFSRLVYCVEHSVCLHYFIPENNMFENRIEGRAREILLEKLYALNSYGWRCILFSDQISNFDVSIWNLPIEPHTLYVKEVEKTLKSKLFLCGNFTLGVKESNVFNTRIIQTVSCHQSSIKDVYQFFMSKWCHKRAQVIPLCSTLRNNKYRYRQYKCSLSTLLKNLYHDAVSGWLMVASLFYKTNQYSKALNIIMYSISKCTVEKLYFDMTLSDIHYQLLKLQLFKEKSFGCMLKIMLVDNITFEINSALTPDEIQMNESNSVCCLPSTAYAYFLNFLCHYHLNNVRQCQDSLRCLQLVINKDYLNAKHSVKAEAYKILGIALHLLGK
ncbi:uncharacterized protein LOC127708384 [Mytilus californianus]|uniref:uncharacterized protein LOC127708384 n=1 Tax=Mytilus californianus TaxID=6549 RepID=UPI002248546A|nr:uncharacterized protein LOC127708384 [Mytilus californianus]